MQERESVQRLFATLLEARTRTSEAISGDSVHFADLVDVRPSRISDRDQEQQDSDCSNSSSDILKYPSNKMISDDSQIIGETSDEVNHNQAMDCNEKEPASNSDVTMQEPGEQPGSTLRNNPQKVNVIY